MIAGFFKRLKYWRGADRIGPDIPATYWMLFFKTAMLKLCKKKFKHFADDAEFRPGSYAIGCSRISLGKRVVIRALSVLDADDSGEQPVELVIEDDVLMAPGIHIYTNNHAYHDPTIPIYDQGYYDIKSVRIKRGAWISANVVIMSGVTVGENSVVAAGSIVTRDVPDRVVVAGNPARVIKHITSTQN